MSKILVIEDERDIAELVEYNLKNAHLQVELCFNGRQGLERAQVQIPDLIILDLMLPDLSGIEICKRLKKDLTTQQIPILMLTARAEEIDRVVGLEVGAEDYLTKPFSPRELVLRVQAILKRCQPGVSFSDSAAFQFGKLQVNPQKFEVKVGEQEVKLTALEFRLLKFLYETRGRVATRDILLDKVWGYEAELNTRTVDTYVKRLREKLGEAGDYVETLRGVGYRFKEQV